MAWKMYDVRLSGGAEYKIELQIIWIYEEIASEQKYQTVMRQTLLFQQTLVRQCVVFLNGLVL